jgi:FAD/FMN-containing dehydrogenase
VNAGDCLPVDHLEHPETSPGTIPSDPVAPDALVGVSRQQTLPSQWDGGTWAEFTQGLRALGIAIREEKSASATYRSDAGGVVYGTPHGVALATSAEQVAAILQAAQRHRVPVKTRGGALTTEGESVAHGGLLLDMAGMSRVLSIDDANLTVRTEAGIYWHSLAEALRRQGLDYLSAPLNMTASVGGTLCVGGIDINSPRLGCSADQALAMQVVTPTGEIVECSEDENSELFERVLLGYGQFGVITEATLRIRPYTPITMRYYYYSSLRTAIEDLQWLVGEDASDYAGILTMLDKAVNLLVAFDSDEREREFLSRHAGRLRGHGELGFALHMAAHYALRPWRVREALYLLGRKRALLPEFSPFQHMRNGKIDDRSVVFSRAVWKFWGSQQLMIPDLATSAEKFVEAVERGNAVCKKYFPHYTLYCVGIKLRPGLPRYEMSCIPPDATGFGWGCEFEPMLSGSLYSRDYLQDFKNEIYDIGVEMKTSYYRFGGSMKGYIRQAFGDEVVDRHLAMKRAADPAMILNADVVF